MRKPLDEIPVGSAEAGTGAGAVDGGGADGAGVTSGATGTAGAAGGGAAAGATDEEEIAGVVNVGLGYENR